ncbi:MAG TPA: hypothetical protein VFY17_07195, partial [Pilimelia sp.]|nr:hypothetical protein [Pilimelia sp.]
MDVRDPDAAEAGVPAPAGRSVPAGAGPAAGAPGEWPYARPRGRHEHSSARWYGRFVAVGGVVLLGASLTAAGALAGRRLA